MRKTLIALAATTGLIGLTGVGASAATVIPAPAADTLSSVQKAEWGCGPRCEYWRHRHWQARREWHYQHHSPYYGYNSYNGYYR